MSLLFLAIAGLVNPAAAGAIGNPGRTTATGVIGFQLSGDQSFQTLTLDDAACEDYCEAVVFNKAAVGRVSLQPADFIGVWAEASWARDVINGLEHDSAGLNTAVGGKLLLPRYGVKPALAARAHWMNTSSAETEEGLSSDSQAFVLEGAGFVVFGDDHGGANLWLGPIATLLSVHDIAVFSSVEGIDDQRLTYSPRLPVGVVLGGEMISGPMGRYLRDRSPRIATGIEVRAIDEWAASGWFAITY